MRFKTNEPPYIYHCNVSIKRKYELLVVGICVLFYALVQQLVMKQNPKWIMLAIFSSFALTIAINFLFSIIDRKPDLAAICRYLARPDTYFITCVILLFTPFKTYFYILLIAVTAALILYHLAIRLEFLKAINPSIFGALIILILTNQYKSHDQSSTLNQLLFHNFNGTIGTVSFVILLGALIYLLARKIINFRLSLAYLLYCLPPVVVLAYNQKFTIHFIIHLLLISTILLNAVFIISDNKTSPTSPYGKYFYAFIGGFLSMLMLINNIVAVTAILLLANIASPIINHIIKGKTNENLILTYIILISSYCFSIVFLIINIFQNF